MVSLMPSLLRSQIAMRDSGSAMMRWSGKWINSLENSTSKTITTPSRLLPSLAKNHQLFIPGKSLTNHSLSQELEDMMMCNKTWTWLNTSKTTSTPIFQTKRTWAISSEQAKPLCKICLKSITMENSPIPPTTILETPMTLPGLTLRDTEVPFDELLT